MTDSPKRRMMNRQFGKELGNLKRDMEDSKRVRRGRAGVNLAKSDFFFYGSWTRVNMVPLDQLNRKTFSHNDMVELLWELYRENK